LYKLAFEKDGRGPFDSCGSSDKGLEDCSPYRSRFVTYPDGSTVEVTCESFTGECASVMAVGGEAKSVLLSDSLPLRLSIWPSLSSESDLEISRPSGVVWGMSNQSRRVYLVFLPIAALYLS